MSDDTPAVQAQAPATMSDDIATAEVEVNATKSEEASAGDSQVDSTKSDEVSAVETKETKGEKKEGEEEMDQWEIDVREADRVMYKTFPNYGRISTAPIKVSLWTAEQLAKCSKEFREWSTSKLCDNVEARIVTQILVSTELYYWSNTYLKSGQWPDESGRDLSMTDIRGGGGSTSARIVCPVQAEPAVEAS